MFMFYYTKYAYDCCMSFEDYCSEDLINVFLIKNIKIKSYNDFKIFAYTFYFEITKELSKTNYKEIKNQFSNYSDLQIPQSNSMFQTVKNYVAMIKNLNLKTAFKTCMIPLIATKEKIVDMVVDVTNSSSLNNLVGSCQNSSNKSEIKSFQSNLSIQTNATPDSRNEMISKRIVGEICQEQINEKELEFTQDIALKADTLVELILNQSNHKVYNIRNFLCYIVELNSELIKLFPEYEDLPDDINLRVIIGARNLYLIALEVYYSIGDLYDINLDTIMQVFKVRYPFSYNEDIDIPIRLFFKVIINNILELNISFNSEEILVRTLNILNNDWEEEINKNAKELTYFCKY